MLVVSYLSQQFLQRLQDAVREVGAEHIQASSWEEVQELIRHKPVSVLVLDPYADRASRADDIVLLLQQFPSTPIIVYTEFTPPALRVLTLLAQYGLRETLLFQIDDDRAHLSRLLTRLGTLPLVIRLLHELRLERSKLTPLVANAVDDLFRRPHTYTSGRDLVLVSHTPLTSLYRALMEAGFAPPKQLFIAARVAHAVAYVRDPGSTVQEVAKKIGYQHPRVLTQHTLSVFGCRPSTLRAMSDDDTLPSLVQWTTLVHGVEDAGAVEHGCDPAILWGTLIGYGQYWEAINRRTYAAWLYQMMIEILNPAEGCSDHMPMAATLLRFGFVLRYLGALETSQNAYQQSRLFAEQADVPPFMLRAHIGMAITMMRRGNLGDTEALLDQVIVEATGFDLPELEAMAYHARGCARVLRAKYADAMLDFFKAYKQTDDLSEREVILGNLAACAGFAGYYKLSSEAHRMLLCTTQSPSIKFGAMATLLEFAVYDGKLAEFEHWKASCVTYASEHELPLDHILHFVLFTAYGVERFSTRTAAINAYQGIIAQAHDAGSHQIVFKAEERLAALMAGDSPPLSPPVHEPPAALRDLAKAIVGWATPEQEGAPLVLSD